MSGWDGVRARRRLTALTEPGRAPVFVDNDVNVMALSERRGHLERHRDLILVKASTGIGAGIVAGGRLLRGALGAAGEIGHTKTESADGLLLPLRRHRLPGGGRGRMGAGAGRAGARARGRPRARPGPARRRRRPGRPAPGPGGGPADRRGGGLRGQPAQPRGGGRRRRPGRGLRHLRGRAARVGVRAAPRRWPPASCGSSRSPTASGPASSAAPPWRSARCWTPARSTAPWPPAPDSRSPRRGVCFCGSPSAEASASAGPLRRGVSFCDVSPSSAAEPDASAAWGTQKRTPRQAGGASRRGQRRFCSRTWPRAATLPSGVDGLDQPDLLGAAAVQRRRGRRQRALADRAVEVGVVVDADDLPLARRPRGPHRRWRASRPRCSARRRARCRRAGAGRGGRSRWPPPGRR